MSASASDSSDVLSSQVIVGSRALKLNNVSLGA